MTAPAVVTTSSSLTTARSSAQGSSDDETEATGAEGLVTQAAEPEIIVSEIRIPAGENGQPGPAPTDQKRLVPVPRKDLQKTQKTGHATFSNKSSKINNNKNRIWVVKSSGKDGKIWTVKTPRKQPSFRVRPNASGFAVSLRYTDEDGRQRTPYLCYLSKREWAAAKQKPLRKFVDLVLKKLGERKGNEANDADRIDALIRLVEAIG